MKDFRRGNVEKICDRIAKLSNGEGEIVLEANLKLEYEKNDDLFTSLSFSRRDEYEDSELLDSYDNVGTEDLEDVVKDALFALNAA